MAVKMNAYITVIMMVVAAAAVADHESVNCDKYQPYQEKTGRMCGSFISGNQPNPSAESCNAYKEFSSLPKTKEQRKKECLCAQQYTYSVKYDIPLGDVISRSYALPAKCGLPFVYSADRKFDCNTVN